MTTKKATRQKNKDKPPSNQHGGSKHQDVISTEKNNVNDVITDWRDLITLRMVLSLLKKNKVTIAIIIIFMFVLEYFKLDILVIALSSPVITGAWTFLKFFATEKNTGKRKNKASESLFNDIVIEFINIIVTTRKKSPITYGVLKLAIVVFIASMGAHLKVEGAILDQMLSIMNIVIDNAKTIEDEDVPVKISERDTESELSDEEIDIYFRSGEYAISEDDWDNPNTIYEQICKFMEDRKKVYRTDDSITVDYENLVLKANEREEIKTLKKDDYLEIINLRENAWEESNTLSVSKLLGNNYHDLALVALSESRDKTSFEYYEVKTILWRFTSLEFVNVDEDAMIHQIHNRYCELKDEEINVKYSEKLEVAFKKACSICN